MKQHEFTNRLINEKSPYLLQHSHNPVNWYPWGNEAFQLAKEKDLPIFLSIGYATCHWCHVMEKESFENVQVAKFMNETFINIKLDREELPEIDNLYMEFAQSMMAGSAGWPLNVILTPELEPFFAATYLPPQSEHGLMGLVDLVARIHEVWTGGEKERVLHQAAKIVEVFAEKVHSRGDELPEKDAIEETAEMLFKMADPVYGGIKGAPKFPIGYQFNFMLSYSYQQKDSRALFLVEKTLDMMHRGGIYDHLGGGFSRYSVDEQWLIPHFEKMLYDNAILAHSYFEAWQVTKKPMYKQVCEEILDYVLRDMRDQEGGFYSAQDADSEGVEGLFYTWTFQEIIKIFGDKEGSLFADFYGVTEVGNFEDRNVLNMVQSIQEYSTKHGLDPVQLEMTLKSMKQVLWKIREDKEHPFKDDKVLSSWNGLMIFALIEAGSAWKNEDYIEAAKKSAMFIKTKLWIQGILYRRWRQGEILHQGGIDEYAFMIRAAIALFEANCGTEWLAWAKEMTNILEIQFKSPHGAFFQTSAHSENVILRKCQFSDGAEPSGNAIHTENLLKLYQITWDEHYLKQAEDVIRAVKKYFDNYSPGYCYHLLNMQRYYDKNAPTIIVVLDAEESYLEELMEIIYKNFILHRSVIWKKMDDKFLEELIPTLKQLKILDDKTTVYVCRKGVCLPPVNQLDDIQEMLERI